MTYDAEHGSHDRPPKEQPSIPNPERPSSSHGSLFSRTGSQERGRGRRILRPFLGGAAVAAVAGGGVLGYQYLHNHELVVQAQTAENTILGTMMQRPFKCELGLRVLGRDNIIRNTPATDISDNEVMIIPDGSELSVAEAAIPPSAQFSQWRLFIPSTVNTVNYKGPDLTLQQIARNVNWFMLPDSKEAGHNGNLDLTSTGNSNATTTCKFTRKGQITAAEKSGEIVVAAHTPIGLSPENTIINLNTAQQQIANARSH